MSQARSPRRIALKPIDQSITWQNVVVDRLAHISVSSVALFYLVAIAEAELITALVHPMWGVIAHIALLGALLIHASFARPMWERALYLSLTIGPLIRIVSLGMPLGRFQQEWWYALASLPLFATSFILMRTIGLRRIEIGLRFPRRRHAPLEILVALTGIPLGIAEFLILRPEPLAPTLTLQSIALPAVILLVGTGVIEELIFRGILQATLAEIFGVWPGIIYVSVLFGVLHIGHLSVVDVLFVTGVALYFGAVVRTTRSLLGVSIAHGMTNITLFVILPLVA